MKKRNKIKKNRKNYLLIIVFIIILALLILFIIFKRRIGIKEYESNEFTFNYDTNWKIKNESSSNIILKNGNKATLIIDIMSIDEEYKYNNLSDFFDDILYNISSQNKGYDLISQKSSKVTKSSYDGYKLLYENNSSQAMITITKIGDKLILFNYEADNKYFDILLDSVQSIIYNFKIKSDKYELKNKVSINTGNVSYSKNDDLVKKIKSLKTYEIANSNYYVNYSLPDIFNLNSFNSTIGSFNYEEDNKRISLYTSILNYNMFDYLDKEKEYSNIYSDYNYIKKDNKYENFKEIIDKYNKGNYNGYIYKVNYTSSEYSKNNIEAFIIVIELNKNHLLKIKIEGSNISIPKQLIDNIKINSVRNYSSYINKKIENNYFSIELKKFINYDYKKYESVKILLPEKYVEVDKSNNIYTDRYFGLNYDYDNEVYQYNIHYKLSNSTKKQEINLANSNINYFSNYGKIKKLSFVEKMKIDNKVLSVYDATYYKKDKLYNSSNNKYSIYKVNEKFIVYELDNGGCLILIIDGNNVKISKKILKELLKFEIIDKDYR